MTEEEARAWCDARYALSSVIKLERYVALLIDEAGRQNLIASSTVADVWTRHIVDSLQIASFFKAGQIVDIGSGAGLPGIPLLCVGLDVTLVEPRRKRVEFLQQCLVELELVSSIQQASADRVNGLFQNVTARAVARPNSLINQTQHLLEDAGRWVLPCGRGAFDAQLPASMVFHVEQSVTDDSAGIIVAKLKGGRDDHDWHREPERRRG